MSYSDLKELIEHDSGLERDALHIHGAILLYLIAMGVFRKSRRSRIPWFVVLGAELANEAVDLTHNWHTSPDAVLAGSLKDLWNTMLWPTALLFLGRYTNWFQRRQAPCAEMRAAGT